MGKNYFSKNISASNPVGCGPVSENIANIVEDYSDKLIAGQQPDRNEYLKQYSGSQMDELVVQLDAAEILATDGIKLRKEIDNYLTKERLNKAKEKLYQRMSGQ